MKGARHLATTDCGLLKKKDIPQKLLCSVQSPGECSCCVPGMLQTAGFKMRGQGGAACRQRVVQGAAGAGGGWRMLSQAMRELSQSGSPLSSACMGMERFPGAGVSAGGAGAQRGQCLEV